MKIRNGFVSNSSSSSFIVHWECYAHDDVEKALTTLFDYDVDLYGSVIPYDPPKFNWFEKTTEECKEKAEELATEAANSRPGDAKSMGELVSMTSQIRPGYFETRFFTSMRNSPLDYGTLMHEMMAALAVENAVNGESRFRVVMTKVEDNS